MPFLRVAAAGEVAPGSALLVEVAGQEIALVNVGGEIDLRHRQHVSSLRRPARGGRCRRRLRHLPPWHGSIFNIKTGEVLDPPAMEGVATCGVRVTGDDIEIDVAVAALRATENFSR